LAVKSNHTEKSTRGVLDFGGKAKSAALQNFKISTKLFLHHKLLYFYSNSLLEKMHSPGAPAAHP
jgi:hypothetical protein